MELLDYLRCPRCGTDKALAAEESAPSTTDETRKGTLRCKRCRAVCKIEDGIVDLLLSPRLEVAAEAAGLERFAEEMRADGWDRDRILRLPNEEGGYWWTQRRSMERLVTTLPFAAEEAILDIGANTCWASAKFAEMGLYTVALDITAAELQGLRTADWWIEANGNYFERVLGDMTKLPFADESFDWVFCCEVLHHNNRQALLKSAEEIRRILRPGGRLLLVNEPLRWPTNLKRDHGDEVAHFDGNEHVYFLAEYLYALGRAGFRSWQLTEPAFHPFHSDDPIYLLPSASMPGTLKLAALNILRRGKRVRRMHMWFRYLFGPDVSLQAIATR